MAGQRNQYPTGKWYDACGQLAESFGWKAGEVRELFAQCVGARVWYAIAKMDREVHEEAAFADCIAIVDKRGAVAD